MPARLPNRRLCRHSARRGFDINKARSAWVNLTVGKRQELNQLFTLNRKVFTAYLLKESLDRLWSVGMKEPC